VSHLVTSDEGTLQVGGLASVIRLPGALLKRGRGQPGVDCPQCPWSFAGLGRWIPWPPLVHASDARGVGAIGSLPTPAVGSGPRYARTGPRRAGRLTGATAPSPALAHQLG
jgi:hypothetical protein